MALINDLIDDLNVDVPVRTVLVGSHWVVVCSRTCGMASALRSPHSHGTPEVQDAGCLHLKPAQEVIRLTKSKSFLEASIGVAAINALLDVDDSLAVEMNAADVLIDRGKDKRVALVGRFPFILKLKQVTKALWVLEQRQAPGEYPAEAADELLPRADVVAITGTALINGSVEALLGYCRPESTVMVLGPSTPLSPVWFDYGVDILSGTRVLDEEAVLCTVSQGASFRQVKGVERLTFFKN